MHAFSREELDCIQACQRCYLACFATAMTHCLDMGGEHVRPQHFRLMIDCAVACKTAADFIMTKSRYHKQMCGLCADACEVCAKDCEGLGGMADCVIACRACADDCRAMAA